MAQHRKRTIVISALNVMLTILWSVSFAAPAHAQSCYVVGSAVVDGSQFPSSGGPWPTFYAASQAAVAAECAGVGGAWCGGTVSCTNGGVPNGSTPGSCTVHYNPQGTYSIDGLGNGQPLTGSGCPVQSSGKDPGPSPCEKGACGEPIVMSVANKILKDIDFVVTGPNPLKFQRFYNSTFVAASAANFAQGWMHNYAMSVSAKSSTSTVVSRPDGKWYTFNLVSNTWTPDVDISDKLVQVVTGPTVTGWQYTNATDDSLETYDAYGNLSTIAYRDGTTVTLAYSSGSGIPTFPAPLVSVSDSFGKKLTFSFSGSNLTVSDPNGDAYAYTIGTSGELSSVTYPGMETRAYLYNEVGYTTGPSFPLALTGVNDESSSRYDSTWYSANGAAIKTALAGGVNQYSLTDTVDSSGRVQMVSMVGPLGATEGRGFTSSVNRNRLSSVMRPASSGQPAGNESITYDTNGNSNSSTDTNGALTCSVYDLTRNLETGRVEGFASGSTCPSNIATYVPSAGTAQRKTLTQWHSTWHLPIKRAEPLKITTWTFNGDGGVYCAPTTAKVGTNPIGVVCSRTEQGTTDATGGAGFGATSSGSPRVWTYTYNAYGQVLTAKGPRTDVNDTTTYTYYSCTTGSACGQLNTVTDALGHVTTYLTYDGNGNSLTISDPNGVVTTLTYDPRQRLTSRQVGSETTHYAYYPTGLLQTITLPDASTVTYTYDGAHRLTKISDGLGNYIQYTLDAMGNRTATKLYDPSSTLKRAHTTGFNSLGTLYQDVNAAGTSVVTTTYGNDAQGNQTSAAAPLSRNSSSSFDALNRLTQVTDPAGGITTYGYDGKDNVVSVSDPRHLSTSYTIDGFGETTQTVSPDTGTSTKTYDLNGNLKSSTDARGAVGTYTYDALNRLTQLAFSDQTINYTYDEGTNGIGHLTGASDANHSMAWVYDNLGRVTSKTQVVASLTKSIGYGYSDSDLTSMTTPSGQTVAYTYSNHRISSIKINGTTLLSGVTYDPFGPATGWTWGNGSSTTRSFDGDGSPSQISTAAVTNTYTVDNATRITGLSDSGLSSNSFTFGYDALDRITSGTSSATTRGYTYDADGNWLSETGSQHFTTAISPTSNQLSSTTGQQPYTFTYDAAGNTTSFGGTTFSYNQRGRISQRVSTVTTNYIYDALGEMIYKGPGGAISAYMYDEAGHLVTEYGSSGSLVEETIWMGDIPVAVLKPSGSTVTVYYLHTDHLNTPRKITRPSDNGLMWRWDPDTYGLGTVNNNPAGLGAFSYNLRFAGQVAMNESGLFVNYFRTYNPQQGRYMESDPIGLAGGMNTYAYVGGDPVSDVDSSGLCDPDKCADLANQISNLRNELKKRDYDLRHDKNNLPATGMNSIAGHQQQFENKQTQLQNLLDDYNSQGCPGGGLPADVWNWAWMSTPSPDPQFKLPQVAPTQSTQNTIIQGLLMFLLGGALVVAGSPN